MNQQPTQNTGKINRVLYIVTVILLFAIAVVIAVTTAANKREKNPKLPETSDTVLETELESEGTTAPVTTDRDKNVQSPPESVKPPESTKTEVSVTEPSEQVSAEPPKMDLPAVGILSKKHDTSLQVYSATMKDYRVHCGIDIITEEGAPVYAAADGTVSQIWDDPLMGKCIALSHSGDCYTVYKNLGEEIANGIEAGVNVGKGQLIASVGNTAMIELAEEPHLHFEITVGGEAADPLEFFDDAALVSLTVDSSYES